MKVMFDDKFEKIIKSHSGEIFGHGIEPSAEHRERFEQRLRMECTKENVHRDGMGTVVDMQVSGKVLPLKRFLVAAISTAAVIAGIIILVFLSADKTQGTELADVQNYYNMRLEEQVDAAKLLVQNIDEEEHRMFLLANIEKIESIPVPDVQITDDEYIVLIANVYSDKIEALQNIQSLLRENN